MKSSKVKTVKRNCIVAIVAEPLLVGDKAASALLGISVEYFRQLDHAGKIPQSIDNFGRRKLWSVAELSKWVESGCPNRQRWLKIKDGK